jgi:subtilisin family serine protease
VGLLALLVVGLPRLQPAASGESAGWGPPHWRLLSPGRPATALLSPPANDVARTSILEVDRVRDALALYGQGQVIAIADSGLDSGDEATLSQDFAGRLVRAFALGRPSNWSDPNGHGTHVAGSVLGSGRLSGSDPAQRAYGGSFAGVAPEARLVFQSLLDADGGLGGIPDDLGDLLQQAYDAGARIHTNSWGANFFVKPLARFMTTGRYTPESAQVDRFLWEHPDMVVLFAAGNEGVDFFTPQEGGLEFPPPDGVVDPDSLSSPGTAKNVITVGATESLRSEGGHAQKPYGGDGDLLSAVLGYSYPAEPLASDLPSDNPRGMAAFSSRGPTTDGRIKPDVVAPGTNIISTRSHAPGAQELFGSYDENYVYCSGTSMATPLVAGAAALIRQWYVEQQAVSQPSAALIKATLINGTTIISPGQYGPGFTQDVPDAWPNPVSGWGRVNLYTSLPHDGGYEVWFTDEPAGLSSGQEEAYVRYAAQGEEALRITLVWTDPPGLPEPEEVKLPGITARRPAVLVNDLDLVVESPDGRRLLGNMGADPDRLNNVESVRIAAAPTGEYRILVRGHDVRQGPQPFALVVAGRRVVSGPEPVPEPGAVEPVAREEEQEEAVEGWVIALLAGLGGLIVAGMGVLLYLMRKGRVTQPTPPGRRMAPGSDVGESSRPGSISLPGLALIPERGSQVGQPQRVGHSPFTLGRSPEADLTLAEGAVSRLHARLEVREGRWYLCDLDSANGTYLNRQRVGAPQPLHSGDLIGIGDSVLLARIQAPPPKPVGRATPDRTRLIVAGTMTAVVLLLLIAAVVLLARGEAAKEEGGALPGLPPITLPEVDLPTVDLPTVAVPSVIVPTVELPTGVPSIEVPTGIPTELPLPTDGLPIPTGVLPIPVLPIPTP